MLTKICSTCKVDKTIDQYDLSGLKSDHRRNRCKLCQHAYYESYKVKNKDKLRDKWRKASRKCYNYDKKKARELKRRYNITIDEYNKLYDAQHGKCCICGIDQTLVVDHCHRTGKIRGLLCNGCNMAIGKLGDSVETLEKAIAYLKDNAGDSAGEQKLAS